MVDDKCQAMASPALPTESLDRSFRLDDMIRTTAAMTPDDSKLLLGGSLLTVGNSDDSAAEIAALVQVDLTSDEVEFKRDFDFATSVEAIAPLPEKTVLLAANRQSDATAYFLVVLDSQGSDVAVPALVHQ